MSTWTNSELIELFLNETPLIDVRAPVEFAEGRIPFSVNLPIMNDQERVLVGTTYKEQGQSEAIKLGHQLVSGEVKENRVEAWKHFIQDNPRSQVFCFRGGLRSQTACQWLREIGIEKTPIVGGYKRLRQFFLSILEEAPLPKLVRIGGPTGSAKTHFLKTLPNHIDLEELAHHRGSAFGSMGEQPTQITFENELALHFLRLRGKTVIVEDESATIGKITLPRRYFHEHRHSDLVILEVPFERRIQNIFTDYVSPDSQEKFLLALERIKKSLGGVNYQLIKEEMVRAFKSGNELSYHQDWIGLLLKYYYDPLYFKDIKRQPGKIVFQGNARDIENYLIQFENFTWPASP
jgi:tRNA 2-selenouridine synthase